MLSGFELYPRWVPLKALRWITISVSKKSSLFAVPISSPSIFSGSKPKPRVRDQLRPAERFSPLPRPIPSCPCYLLSRIISSSTKAIINVQSREARCRKVFSSAVSIISIIPKHFSQHWPIINVFSRDVAHYRKVFASPRSIPSRLHYLYYSETLIPPLNQLWMWCPWILRTEERFSPLPFHPATSPLSLLSRSTFPNTNPIINVMFRGLAHC